MIIFIENSEDDTIKMLELINEFGKVIGYKINTETHLIFLYNNNGRSERN